MICVRHRLASGVIDQLWEWDPARRVLMLTIRMGNAPPIDVDVPVASGDRPRHGCFVLTRLDETTWRLSPAVFNSYEGPNVTRAASIHRDVPPEFIYLTHAPDDISEELTAL